MKRVRWAAISTTLCAVAAVIWWRYGVERVQPAEAGEQVRSSSAFDESAYSPGAAREPESSPPQTTPPPVQATDYAAQLRAAPDYLDFARALLPAARAGDHAAQFYIFRALEYCADEYNLYFKRQGIRHSLDDAMKMAVTVGWPFDPEVVRRAYARCHTIIEAGAAELGERHAWLRLASDGGYPRAQVVAARDIFRDLPSSSADNVANREQRRSLVAKAIRSRDPEVIWEIANTPPGDLGPEGDADTEQMAWYFAACQRGFDCSPQSEGVRWACMWDRACQPYESVHDVFRRARGDDLHEIESRARWINQKIDAGDWEALGF